ncbi:MAG: hypothetical protein NC320_01760 [Clostridium sp.]|nr:hypothetical protein [Clostridium sp.]
MIYTYLWSEFNGKLLYDSSMTTTHKEVVEKFENIQNTMNVLLKNSNPFIINKYNFKPEQLGQIINIMNDSDTDMVEVLERYNKKLEQEKAEEERKRAMREYKANFSCPAYCKFLYNDGIMSKCRISIDIFKTCEPYRCGYGINNN